MEDITLTFEFEPGRGLPANCVADALNGVQAALRLMVQHLGGREQKPGKPPQWVTDQSTLRIGEVQSGSLVIDLELDTPNAEPFSAIYGNYKESYGVASIRSLLHWDGNEDSHLPPQVAEKLYEIPRNLPRYARLWLGNSRNRYAIELKKKGRARKLASTLEYAIISGRLSEVNWDRRTAQLRDYRGIYIDLKFGSKFDDGMLRFANQHVEIRGYGRFDTNDEWSKVEVEQLIPTRTWTEPFDINKFLNDKSPNIFNSDNIVRASEPIDAEEFNRFIKYMREDGD